MRRFLLPTFVALVAALTATPAGAKRESLMFKVFRVVCIERVTDLDAAAEMGRALGFEDAPTPEAPTDFDTVVALRGVVQGGVWAIVLGNAEVAAANGYDAQQVRTCSVTASGPGREGGIADVEKWVRVEPSTVDGQRRFWSMRLFKFRPKTLPGDAVSFNKALKQGGHYLLLVDRPGNDMDQFSLSVGTPLRK